MKKIAKFIIPLSLLLVILAPLSFAFAQQEPPAVTYISSISGVYGILNYILGVLSTIFFILAAIFFILAAFKYLTAQGDEGKVGSSKTMLIYSIIAIIVALLATSVIPVLQDLLSRG